MIFLPGDLAMNETPTGDDALVLAAGDGSSTQATAGRYFLRIGKSNRVLEVCVRRPRGPERAES
jgi:hypothetical protein